MLNFRVIDHKPILSIACLFIMAGLITGCSTQAPSSPSPVSNPASAADLPTPQAMAASKNDQLVSSGSAIQPTNSDNNANISNLQQRIILKNATLGLTVKDAADSVSKITQLAENSGGWVVKSQLQSLETADIAVSATISIRVPADKFDATVSQIKAAALSVDSEVVAGEDVTTDYVDLQSQLINLQDTAAQLQKVMASTSSVSDVLTVQSQITQTQGQIEQVKGRLQYYNQAAAYSLIDLTLLQKGVAAPTTPAIVTFGLADWQPGQIVLDAFNWLVKIVQILISALVWIIVFGIPLLILYIIVRQIRRRLPAEWFALAEPISPIATVGHATANSSVKPDANDLP